MRVMNAACVYVRIA